MISCYAEEAGAGRQIVEPIVADPFGDAAAVKTADTIVKESGLDEGYALVLDGRTGALTLALARRTKMQVYAVLRDEAGAARRRATGRGKAGHPEPPAPKGQENPQRNHR